MSELQKKLVERLDEFVGFYNAKDFDQAVKLHHPDVKLSMPETAEVMVGREASVATMHDFHSKGVVKLERERTSDVEALGPDTAMTCSLWKWMTADGQLFKGVKTKDVSIWKLVDGEWLMYVGSINSC